jgi:UDP-N-acetylglucosamine 4,6-dehydratase/5-epimerase
MPSFSILKKKFTETVPAIDLNDQSILVTGGTGTFGHAFIKHILKNYSPKRLIIFSRDEFKQYEMAQKFKELDKKGVLRFFLGDVRDLNRLELALREVDYVIHAAALKHVPAAEYNPFECIQTNVTGAQNLVTASLRQKVKALIGLSTDKAVNPVNLYGASKLAAEKIFIASNHLSGDLETKFAVIRYGNVIGSRGSVVPFFNKLIQEGAKSLPITDPRMTRFWLTIEEGVDFVLSSMTIMEGGEIFVPQIPSLKMSDLAYAMAPHLKQNIIGIRPGEKLHEDLISSDESRSCFEIEDRYILMPNLYSECSSSLKPYNPQKVEEGFRYSSDQNKVWIQPQTLFKQKEAA